MVSEGRGFLQLELCTNLLSGQTFAPKGLAGAPGRGWCHRFGEQKLSRHSACGAVASFPCQLITPRLLQPHGSSLAAFFPFFKFSLSLFFWNPVQHEHSRDPKGFAAIRLVLCQILRWGKAGGNPFCNVSSGAVGKNHARCSSPWPGSFLCCSSTEGRSPERAEQGSDLPNLCSLLALLQICLLFILKSLLPSQPAPPGP